MSMMSKYYKGKLPPQVPLQGGADAATMLVDAIKRLNGATRRIISAIDGAEPYSPNMYIDLLNAVKQANNLLAEQAANSATQEYQKLKHNVEITQVTLTNLRNYLRMHGMEKAFKGTLKKIYINDADPLKVMDGIEKADIKLQRDYKNSVLILENWNDSNVDYSNKDHYEFAKALLQSANRWLIDSEDFVKSITGFAVSLKVDEEAHDKMKIVLLNVLKIIKGQYHNAKRQINRMMQNLGRHSFGKLSKGLPFKQVTSMFKPGGLAAKVGRRLGAKRYAAAAKRLDVGLARRVPVAAKHIKNRVASKIPSKVMGAAKFIAPLSGYAAADTAYRRFMHEDEGAHKSVSSNMRKGINAIENKLIRYLKNNPNPTDEQFHAYAESHGVSKDKMEEVAYNFASRYANVMASGKSKGNKDSVSNQQLRMGIKVEKEHTDDPVLAEKIARDHLAEDPGYYSHLKDMEERHSVDKE